MRIDGPQVTSSLSLNGTTITDLNVFVTTGSLNGITGSYATTGSLNSFTSSANSRLNSIEGVSGSYATTGSNLFKGSQTISGSVIPAVDNTYDLGSITHQFRDLYLSSASLYIDGTKVLGSTAQELQITTDTGQSFKILESSSDTITLQSADGNITLATSGGGDVIMDPTNGVIGLKGTVTVYTGNKITSSDGNSIQFGNGIAVTGSIVSTVTPLVSGSSQVLNGSGVWSGSAQLPSGVVSGSSQILNGSGVWSGSAQLPSGIISGSSQLPSGIVSSSLQVTEYGFGTTGSNTFVGTQVISGSILQSGSFTTTGTIIAQTINVQSVTSSVVYSSGSNVFGNDIGNSQVFTGSVLITGSLTISGASSAGSYSGTTIYGSTVVCSAVGKFTSCIDAYTGNFTGNLSINKTSALLYLGNSTNNSYGALQFLGNASGQSNTLGELDFYNKITGVDVLSGQIEIYHDGTSCDNKAAMLFRVHNGTSLLTPLTIASTGAVTFACNVSVSGVLQVRNTSSTPSIWAGQYGGAISILGDNSTSNRYIDLSIVDSTGALATQGLRLTNSGNVGIGTCTPTATLHIVSPVVASGTALKVVSDGNSSDKVFEFTGIDGLAAQSMYMFQTGTVGLGTCGPNAKLTVWTPSTTGMQTALRLNNPFGFANGNTGAKIVFSQDRSCSEDYPMGEMGVGQEVATTSGYGYMAFSTVNTTMSEKMRITSGGNVVIGNTTAYGGLTVSDFTANDCNDSIALFYRGTTGGHESSIKFYDFRCQHNASISNNLHDDTPAGQRARLVFKTSNGGAPVERMRIWAEGVVTFCCQICTPGISITSNAIGVEYLIVAGGGGGGFDVGGGGGAGGTLLGSTGLFPGTYQVGIGAGGAGATAGAASAPTACRGYSTYAMGLIVIGGGGGGNYPGCSGGHGGSGGGGAGYGATTFGGVPMVGAGCRGGDSVPGYSIGATGAGGGGATGQGCPSACANAGCTSGGAGVLTTIIGTSCSFSCGGRGGGDSWSGPIANGFANSGYGGDGAGNPNSGCSGGSGIFVIKALNTNTLSFSGGLTVTTCTNLGGFNIYAVTAGAGTMTIS